MQNTDAAGTVRTARKNMPADLKKQLQEALGWDAVYQTDIFPSGVSEWAVS